MKKNIIIILFLLICIPLYSQDKIFIDSLLNLLKTEKVDSTKVNLLNEISWEYSYSLPEKSKEYAEKAIKLAEEIDFYKGMADAYKNIGNSYKNQSSYHEAIIYYKKAIKIYKKIDFNEGIARSMNNIGLVKQEQAYYEDALKIFLEALNYAELSKNHKTISLCLNNIGLVFYSIKDYNRALKYYNKSLAIKKELNDTKGITNCYNNIANVYAEEKKYDSAKTYYQYAMDLLENLNDSQGLIMVNLNIAIIYTEMDSAENALPYLEKSIKLSEESNNASGLCVSYSYMAKALCSQKKISQAEFYANKALFYAKKLNLRNEENDIYEIFSEIYAQKKDFEKALDYFRLFKKESDSLLNDKNQELVLEMEAKYETEKKEKEIEVQNILIDKQNSEIDFQTKTKYFFISLFILILMLAILLFRGYRIKNRNNNILLEKNVKIEQQKNEIEKSNKNINSSIFYASRIQNSVLPNENVLKEFVKDSFILWKPKNIVSGDFYFIKNYSGTLYLSAADCTGHGVPGAFMSMLGITLINEIIRKPNITESSQVLEELRKQIKLSLQQTGQQGEQQDGLDIAFCSIKLNNLELSFAGAHNSCLIFRNENEIKHNNHHLHILDADHQPVGIYAKERPFTEHKFQLQPNDTLYVFSDGYASQFGGTRKEKLKIKPFQAYLSEICHFDLSQQKQILEDKFEKWKGDNEQTDDVLVIGIRI